MDKKTEKILDQLCADEIDVKEAAKALNMSIEDVFKLADEYDYIPTSEELIEACKIERETINHIKFAALQKIETKARSQKVKPQLTIKDATMDEIPSEVFEAMLRSKLDYGTNRGGMSFPFKARILEA
jgi:hypothetical protein